MNDKVSKQFSHLGGSYLNTAYSGPIPFGAKEVADQALEAEMNPAKAKSEHWLGLNETVRATFADLIGCETKHVSHNTSAAEIIGLVATGFPFKKGDFVIGMEGDFPANVLPWKVNQARFNFQFKQLPEEVFFNTDLLLERLPPQTRVVNISHVKFDTGRRLDLLSVGKALKKKNIFFVVDSAQGFGGIDISKKELDHIDVLACPSYKWLLGPFGHAFGYFSETACNTLKPTYGHWYARSNSHDPSQLLSYQLTTKPGAYCFDRGQAPDLIHLSILKFSLDFLNSIGLKEIEKHNIVLAQQLITQINTELFEVATPTPQSSPQLMSGIVSIRPRHHKIDAKKLVETLAHHEVFVSHRQERIRVSLHLMNTNHDIVKFIDSLAKTAT